MNDILKIAIGIITAGVLVVGGFVVLTYIAYLTTG